MADESEAPFADNTAQKQRALATKTRRISTLRTGVPTTKGNEIVERIATFRPPTDAERGAIVEAIARADARPARGSIKSEVKSGGSVSIWPAHSDGEGFVQHTLDTFGTSSSAFCNASLSRLDPLLRNQGETRASDGRLNAALAVMGAVAPENELEAIIGEQIIGAHALSIDLMGKVHLADTIPKMEAYINMATKLSRTMAAQVEALSRLRSGGKQQVIVKHVYINGNAVVGDHAQAVLQAGGRGSDPGNIGQSHAARLFDAPGPAVWSQDQIGLAVPVAGGSGTEALSDARRNEPRRADRRGKRSISNGQAHSGAPALPLDGARPCQARKEHTE